MELAQPQSPVLGPGAIADTRRMGRRDASGHAPTRDVAQAVDHQQ
jgi:hypothetical protein